ncbi:MAG TPA: hypothetical protein VJS14_17395 [Enterobacteriaceae bacterium]|nr:hypothetical protein [Enterobacteriaceae bacterium]
MVYDRQKLYILCLCFASVAILAGYYYWHRYYVQPFSCRANLVQHHPDETLSLWLNYIFEGKSGMLSMNGRLQSSADKKINRKITFRVERKDHIYSLKSVQSIKFPDDNVADSWLEKYEPQFFIYPEKRIDMRITEQQNGNYLFALGMLPTFLCRSANKA